MKLTINPTKKPSKAMLENIAESKGRCARLLADLQESNKQLAELLKFQAEENSKFSAFRKESEGNGVKALTAKRKLSDIERDSTQTAAAIEQTEGVLCDLVKSLQESANEVKDLYWQAFGAPARCDLMDKRLEAVRPFFSDERNTYAAASFYGCDVAAERALIAFFSPVFLGSLEPECLSNCVQEMLERFKRIEAGEAPVYWDSAVSSVE